LADEAVGKSSKFTDSFKGAPKTFRGLAYGKILRLPALASIARLH
jgi:hypothetical protein